MISCILFGNFILFNLFLGLISYTFDRTLEEDSKKNGQEIKKETLPDVKKKDDRLEKELNKQLAEGEPPSKGIDFLESPLKATQINESPLNEKIRKVASFKRQAF